MDLKLKITQFLCRHEYVKYKKVNLFLNLSGERIYIQCEKCGKDKGSYFIKG